MLNLRKMRQIGLVMAIIINNGSCRMSDPGWKKRRRRR